MKEEILQFVWNNKLFNTRQLQTTDGESIQIIHQGFLNQISGPDFSEARIKIGVQEWVGSIEIHINSSDWMKHNHQGDHAYNNVILHVVFNHDEEVKTSSGEQLRTLELKGLIPLHIISKYEFLKQSKDEIPCEKQFEEIPNIVKSQWVDRLLVQRLERKANDVFNHLKQANGDWLQAFYVMIAGYLGQNTNKQSFQELARELPLNLLLKYQDKPLQIEAMLFGVADLIPESGDEYTNSIRTEFEFLRHKHDLANIHSMWKFGGVRPPAFPTRRIAVLAAMVTNIVELRSALVDKSDAQKIFDSIKLSEYWDGKFQFGDKGRKGTLNIAHTLRELLIINVFSPYAYAFGLEFGDEKLKEYALDLISKVPAEDNHIVNTFGKIGFNASNAADTQALIELKSVFCNYKKCVLCSIGKTILARES